MGAKLLRTRTFDGKLDRIGLRKAYNEMVKEEKYERVPGTFPGMMIFMNRVFDNLADAWEYLEDNASKWGPAITAKVVNENSKISTWCIAAEVAT